MKYMSLGLISLLVAALAAMPGCSKEPSDEELLKSATEHQRSDEFDEAIGDFQQLVQKHPKSDKAPEALFATGVIYLNHKKEYIKAESVYTKLVMEYPQHPTAQGAAYQRARIFLEQLHKPDSAVAAYELFLQRYPDAFQATSARTELADLKKKPSPAK
jgi:TolA-binding protein